MRAPAIAVLMPLLVLPGPRTRAQSEPALADLLKLGAEYVAGYPVKVSGVVLEEQFRLTEMQGGRALPPKRIASDLTFVNGNDETRMVRDVFAVDTTPTRERTPRVSTVLKTLTPESWQKAQEFWRENAYHFMSNVVMWGSEPTLAFQLLKTANQPKLVYRLDGRKKLNDVAVIGVRFQEPTARDKVYILGTPGNAAASGRFWIEPATGAIHAIDLWLESPTESASIAVQFAPDPTLKLVLPRELSGTFEQRELGAGVRGSGTERNLSRRIEGVARYSNPRHFPIK
jgi:hypothetical protein